MRMDSLKKGALVAVGGISLFLGTLGVFLPLLPTTPFLLLAAWCFMKSSPRLNQWLLSHRKFGPAIKSWKEERAISVSAKILATVTALISLTLSWIFTPIIYVNLGVTTLLIGVMIFVWTRPTPSNETS